MSRALEREFGAAPDLDIEAQRAFLILEKPMRLDWKRVSDLIGEASYTFGGAHFRARGRIRRTPEGVTEFEFAGSAQVIPISEPVDAAEGEIEISARVEDWGSKPKIVVLDVK